VPASTLEDLYYALLALTQEMHINLTMRVNNGFSALSAFFSTDEHQIIHILKFLLDQWHTLNNPSLVKALDSAIRHSRYRRLDKQLTVQWIAGDYTKEDYEELKNDLQDPTSYATLPGLNWIAGWSPAMINAQLSQKYRKTFSLERKVKVKQERWEHRKLHMEKAHAGQKENKSRCSWLRSNSSSFKSRLIANSRSRLASTMKSALSECPTTCRI
jgi:hypothetical protein